MRNTSLLIVEDNPADVLLIKEQLSEAPRKQYDIAVNETLAEAIERLKDNDIDVVLLDLSLPDSSGLDTVRTLTTKFPGVVIIVLTGLQDEQIALQAVRYGAQDYIEKNQITSILLNRSISYSIERKKTLQEKERLLGDLSKILDQLEILQGILPICAACRRIRDNDGNWQQIGTYIKNHAKGESHDICPDCYSELYPAVAQKGK
ncbi:MAG: response regulator [Deltaproteobacteria bacterium]|nr:response regulator [Deltaproteobacteria bacterium]